MLMKYKLHFFPKKHFIKEKFIFQRVSLLCHLGSVLLVDVCAGIQCVSCGGPVSCPSIHS